MFFRPTLRQQTSKEAVSGEAVVCGAPCPSLSRRRRALCPTLTTASTASTASPTAHSTSPPSASSRCMDHLEAQTGISKFPEMSDISLKFSLPLTAGWEIIWKKSSVLRPRSRRSTRDRLEIYSLITSTLPRPGWRPQKPSERPRMRPTSCWRR